MFLKTQYLAEVTLGLLTAFSVSVPPVPKATAERYSDTWEKVKMKALVTQSGQTLCDPMDYSLPESHRIPQARILKWVAMPFSRGSSDT